MEGNIRIVSDGTLAGTKVVLAESGEPIPGFITGVDWSAIVDPSARGGITVYANVSFVNPEIDVTVDNDSVSYNEHGNDPIPLPVDE